MMDNNEAIISVKKTRQWFVDYGENNTRFYERKKNAVQTHQLMCQSVSLSSHWSLSLLPLRCYLRPLLANWSTANQNDIQWCLLLYTTQMEDPYRDGHQLIDIEIPYKECCWRDSRRILGWAVGCCVCRPLGCSSGQSPDCALWEGDHECNTSMAISSIIFDLYLSDTMKFNRYGI